MRRLTDDRDRRRAALAAAALTAGLGAVLMLGLAAPALPALAPAVEPFVLLPPAPLLPKPEPQPQRARAPRPKGAAAPPNRRARATELVAPVPLVPPSLPPPLVTIAPLPATGTDRSSGAAPVEGLGTGAGGAGAGFGSGDGGDGDGGGGGSDAVQIGGRITGRDYPPGPLRAHIEGRVTIHYVITPRGRVTGCRIVRSSGNAELDTTTCRLVTQRFRFRPARDAMGRKIADELTEDHSWVVFDGPPADD